MLLQLWHLFGLDLMCVQKQEAQWLVIAEQQFVLYEILAKNLMSSQAIAGHLKV